MLGLLRKLFGAKSVEVKEEAPYKVEVQEAPAPAVESVSAPVEEKPAKKPRAKKPRKPKAPKVSKS